MAESKRYYWIKLKTDFFADDSPMDALLSLPNGAEYVCIYIKLCLSTANKGGRLCTEIGEMLIPYDIEKIQKDVKHFSIDTVRVAFELYKKMGLIYEETDGVLAITGHEDMVGSEGQSAKWMRDKRARDAHILITDKSQCDIEIRDKSIEIRDKSIDKDIDNILNLYSEICVSFPEVKKLTDKRKKAIKARLKTYSVDDFKEVFIKAEQSDFLKGSNGWKANFDWLINESNMVKVLEDNYCNKTSPKPKTEVEGWFNS